MTQAVLQLGSKITLVPVIHGSGDMALEIRRLMLEHKFDCVAVPLPESFRDAVELGIEQLPTVTVVVQREGNPFSDNSDEPSASYVTIDPCQPVIAALRIAMGERMARAYIDLETERFRSTGAVFPDPFALKKVPLARFSASLLPAIPPPADQFARDRIQTMAARLRELESRFESVLCVCSYSDWPWIRDAYLDETSVTAEPDQVMEPELCSVKDVTLLFLLGELPFVTGLYERARAELDDDERLSIDGLKELVLTARDQYETELKSRARKITPKLLGTYFQYVRNLALVERRMTPDLYTLVTAAKQIGGDQFAIQVAETAREYPYQRWLPFPECAAGVGKAELPNGDVVSFHDRLPGHPVSWRSCELIPRPPKEQQDVWATRWNPFGQCSWPPEDNAIESFRSRVKDAALDLVGGDMAQTEKFSTSLKDGLDIRETLRNWHTGDLFVKVFPPSKGRIDCVVMLFDTPADPRDYPWRITWHAEHHDESTLSLFATDFSQQLVGPGVALATYGGAMFLFPPRPIPDIWHDPKFDFVDTLEERLLAAALEYSREKHIALLSPAAPGAGWRRLARRYGRTLVHVPLNRFSSETVQQLRMFHVLNGQHVRSYATHFIRKG